MISPLPSSNGHDYVLGLSESRAVTLLHLYVTYTISVRNSSAPDSVVVGLLPWEYGGSWWKRVNCAPIVPPRLSPSPPGTNIFYNFFRDYIALISHLLARTENSLHHSQRIRY